MKGNESGSILRVGKVSAFDAGTLRARVNFPDMGIVSHWLPVIIMNSAKTKDTHYLDAGEHVVCVMQGTGAEAGYVLGAIYDDKNRPEIQDENVRSVKFDDGTLITYDRQGHKLAVNVSGDIEIIATGKVKILAERIDLN